MPDAAPRARTLSQIVEIGALIGALHALTMLAAGGLSLLGLPGGWLSFFGLLDLIAQTMVLLVVSLYRAIPIRVIAAYFLGPLWIGLSLLPVPFYIPDLAILQILSGLVQLASLALAAWLWTGDPRSGGRARVPPEVFAGLRVSPVYAMVFHGLLTLGLVVGVPLFLYANAALAIYDFTDGFAKLRWWGVEMSERRYVRGGDEVRLIATIHIADPTFYAQINPTLQTDDAVVLHEGVTDREGLLPRFGYGRAADRLGLSEQNAGMAYNDAESPADVDVSEFSETTLGVLAAVNLLMQGDPAGYLEAAGAWSEDLPGLTEALRYDLLVLRNDRALRALDEALDADPDGPVVLPWGALHMPGLETGVLERGFEETARAEIPAIRWAGD